MSCNINIMGMPRPNARDAQLVLEALEVSMGDLHGIMQGHRELTTPLQGLTGI